jgi:Fe-S-cluster containining protein
VDRRLLLADGVVFTCQHSGACCRSDWRIGVDPGRHARLRGVDWSPREGRPDGELFVPLPEPAASGERVEVARRPDGACVFLTPDTRCAIHARLGASAKPRACREFPYQFVDTPDGVAVGLSYACTAVRTGRGRPLGEQRAEIADILASSPNVRRLPEPIPLFGTLTVSWTEYRSLEASVLDLLDEDGPALPTALVAGSALVGVAVALAEVQRRARTDGRAPAETVVAGLERMRAARCRPLVEVGAAARPPRRGTTAPLALLYTWLELGRRRPSRAGLVLGLYRNLYRFRRGRGRVPDLVTGHGTIALQDVAHVVLDLGRGELDAYLRGYWRHVVFRKSLVPMHGVFRGYQTLVLLHAFTRWTARAQAARRGAVEVALDDLREAVRLVEQRFVLHARFGELWALSPVLTLMADRLFRQPAFVRACAL